MTDIISRNNINIRGAGSQPILFAHGYGCDQNMWRHVTPAFEQEYKVILFDLVGFGNSDLTAFHPVKYKTLQGWADDLLEICEALSLQDLIFVGHSVSAMIGMLATLKKPEIFSHLIMVGPSPCYINDGDYQGGFSKQDIDDLLYMLDSNYLGWSSNMAPVIMGNPDNPELGQELTNSFCRTEPNIAKHVARVTFLSDNRQDLSKLKTPTLIMQCSNDVIAPDTVGLYLKESIPGSVLFKMKAQGHCPNLSAPKETIELIKRYLSESAFS